MTHCREKGLCYNGDEKWSFTHRCKGHILLFIAKPNDIDNPPNSLLPEQPCSDFEPTPPQPLPRISLNALSGLSTPKTFQVYGSIHHFRIIVLINSGSTHSFIQPHVAKFLTLPMEDTSSLRVMVDNGLVLECLHRCADIPQLIQSHSFTATLHVLPVKHLGPIVIDYTTLSIKFIHLGRPVELHADVANGPTRISTKQIKHMIQIGSTSSLFHLSLQPIVDPDASPELPHHIYDIQAIITKFAPIFLKPTNLLPPIQIVHHINLIPSASPVNVRLYRCSYFQKSKIKKQASELLYSGMIRINHSPFSSPVLLVKKKDSCWRMCINYRALNSITIHDCFLMPTIDELLDDLAHASRFTKLDLCQDFHYILMTKEDITKMAFRTHHGHYEYRVSLLVCAMPLPLFKPQ